MKMITILKLEMTMIKIIMNYNDVADDDEDDVDDKRSFSAVMFCVLKITIFKL